LAIIYLTDHEEGYIVYYMDAIKTLREAVVHFSNFENCKKLMVELRWPDGAVKCPRCDSDKVTFLSNARVWKCYGKHPMAKFSLKTGTIFEDSPLGLEKWLPAVWLLVNCKNGVSSCELARDLGVTQKTAWFMAHRLRFALTEGGFELLSGEVQADETYIGGKSRNMHKDVRARKITANGVKDKTAVVGMLERGGRIRTMVVKGRKKPVIQAAVRQHVAAGSALYTDALRSYEGLTEYEQSGRGPCSRLCRREGPH
jgi:transposase-like protein